MNTQLNPSLLRRILAAFFLLTGIARADIPDYQYFRFSPTELRGNPGLVQLAEFQLTLAGVPLTGATATTPTSTNNPPAEAPPMAVDGDLGTKWLNFDAFVPLVLDFGAPVSTDAYRLGTGNDAPERDPVTWTVEGSNDNLNWDLLDSQTLYPVPTDRGAYTPEIYFCRPLINDFSTTMQIIANGDTTNLDFNTTNADTLTIDNGGGAATPPNGSQNVTPPADADTLYTLSATNAATPVTTTASQVIRSVAAGSSTWRYVRFTPVRLREALGGPAANSIQVGEFEFYNLAAEVVPISATDDGNNPGGGNEGADKLIDGNYATKWLNFGKGAPVVFDMGSSVTIDSYSFVTGNDAPERDPIAWLLEGSDDQVCWTTMDNVSVLQSDPGQPFNFLPPLGRGALTQIIPLPAAATVPLPVINLFGALPQIVEDGDPITLIWDTSLACTLSIDQGVGAVTGDVGSTPTTPPANADTIYTLTATNVNLDDVTFPGGVRSVVRGEATYELIRFTPLRLAETLPFFGGANSVQIADFQFFNDDVTLDLSPTGLNPSVSNPGGNFPGAEGPEKLIDGNPGTKWLDFNKAPIIFDFGSGTPVTIDGYAWTTANDAPERDPIAWRLEGSNDGSTWELIDTVDKNRAAPTEDAAFYFGLPRGTSLPQIPVPDPVSIPPAITLFTGNAPALYPGDPLTLTWETLSTTTVTLDDGTGPVGVALSGSAPSAPIADTTYTLTATGPGGSVQATFDTVLVTSLTNVICYEDFDAAGDELILLGNAAVLNDFPAVTNPGDASRLRLTADAAGQAGTAWFAKRVDFSSGFQTFFGLHFLGASNDGADGISFMIQDNVAGNGAEPNGFNENGLSSRSLNIKFDSYQNAGEPSAAIVEVTDELGFIASVDLTTIPALGITDLSTSDFASLPFQVQIDYVQDDLDIYINGILVIDSAFVDLVSSNAVDGSGKAYAGFSSRTGGAFEAHDITDWVLFEGTPPPPLELIDFSFDLGAATAVFTFNSANTRTYRILESTDGQTFNPLATGIPGQAGTTTTSPLPFVATPAKLFRVQVESPKP